MVAAGIKVGHEGVNNVKARNIDIKWYHRLSLQMIKISHKRSIRVILANF